MILTPYSPIRKYKPVGVTPKQLLDEVEESRGVRYFHLGNLDPMAEGLMVFVPHKLRFLEKYLKSLKKEYEFSVILGFSTDTHDLLGYIRSVDCEALVSTKVNKVVKYFKGQKKQSPPKVSYRNLNTRAKVKRFLKGQKLPELPKQNIKIYDFEFSKKREVSKKQLFSYLYRYLNDLNGNFRQEKVLESYEKHKQTFSNTFIIYDMKIKVSSGFYIRGLVRDMSEYLNVPMTAFKIKRIKVGFWKL